MSLLSLEVQLGVEVALCRLLQEEILLHMLCFFLRNSGRLLSPRGKGGGDDGRSSCCREQLSLMGGVCHLLILVSSEEYGYSPAGVAGGTKGVATNVDACALGAPSEAAGVSGDTAGDGDAPTGAARASRVTTVEGDAPIGAAGASMVTAVDGDTPSNIEPGEDSEAIENELCPPP